MEGDIYILSALGGCTIHTADCSFSLFKSHATVASVVGIFRINATAPVAPMTWLLLLGSRLPAVGRCSELSDAMKFSETF